MAKHSKEAWSKAAIAARLKATREALGLSQRELCDKTGFTGNQYNPWEKGHSIPTVANGIVLSNTFDLTLDWIYFGDDARLPKEIAEAISMRLQAQPAPELSRKRKRKNSNRVKIGS